MKNTDKIPSAQFDYIADIIREREQKNLPTFFTISIEQYDKATPVAEKEYGYENFKQQILKFTSDYNLTSISISIFSAKSRNAKAIQIFKVPLTKQTPTVVFSGLEKQSPGIEQLDSSIPVSRYYDEKFEYQLRIMRSEMEKTNLLEKISQLTERYEEKLRDKDLLHSQEIKNLKDEVNGLKEDLFEYEREIAKNEKDKHNSFGNIALGSISARAIEGFAKSPIGLGVLKGLLGESGFETLQGHLAGIEDEGKETAAPETARIITQPVTNTPDPKQIVLNYIQKVYTALPDKELRMVYDIMEVVERNLKDLELLWSVALQVKDQRNKTAGQKNESPVTDQKSETEEEKEEERDSDNDNLHNIE